ncbi:MAG TPA: hypothetical protein VF188_13130, partial [Longimicrobiales bacterium]
WQTYYRGAVAYRVSEEPWFHVPGITELKLRYARGTAGDRTDLQASFGALSAPSPDPVPRDALGSRDLHPPRATEQEVGIDVVAFDRVSLQLSYVDQTTEDLVALALGGSSDAIVRNAGTMSGQTWEATLGARLIDRPGLRWSSTLVADRSRSRIDELDVPCYFTRNVVYCEGNSISDIWGGRFARSPEDLPAIHAGSLDAFQINDDGYLVPVGAGNSWRDGLRKDLWGTTITIDGINYAWGVPIEVTDSTGRPVFGKIGSSRPDVSLGWLNNLSWHGFDVHTVVHAQLGGQVYNYTRQLLYHPRRHGDLDQSGKPDERKKPVEYYEALYNDGDVSEPFLEDGTFVKLRELSVRYNLSEALLSRIGLGGLGADRAAIGIIGRNLLTLTDYSGFDPEVGGILQRYDLFSYPNTRTITGMVEITF